MTLNVMTLNQCSRHAIGVLVCFAIVVANVSTASAEWKEKVLYSFQDGTDGSGPVGGLVFGSDGSLYGATQFGGANDCSPMAACGTVYQLAPPAKQGAPWTETLLHVFEGKQQNDGEYPSGGVIADALGNIYGTSAYGGTGDCVLLGIKGGCGTVFELSPPQTKGGQWTYTILYSFKGGKDGYLPFGDLVFDSAGNLYGATYFGGGKGTSCDPFYQYCGTVFKLSPQKTKGGQWTEKVLHSFAGGTDGANPNGGLALDSKGAIYGTTLVGGYHQGQCDRGVGYEGCGTVFALRPPAEEGEGWKESVLYRFKGRPSDGVSPNGRLLRSTGGSLYGTTIGGGSHEDGVVFKLTPPAQKGNSWKESLIHVFTGAEDGQGPWAGLAQGSDGSFYGSAGGSPSRGGLIFRMRPPALKGGAWTFVVLYSFTGSPDGYDPLELTLGKGGVLFGATLYGGTGGACQGGCGTVFRAAP